LDIRKDGTYVIPAFENPYRFVRIHSRDRFESCSLDHIDRAQTNQRFVFYNKHNWSLIRNRLAHWPPATCFLFGK
jgi:hypothetical protein